MPAGEINSLRKYNKQKFFFSWNFINVKKCTRKKCLFFQTHKWNNFTHINFNWTFKILFVFFQLLFWVFSTLSVSIGHLNITFIQHIMRIVASFICFEQCNAVVVAHWHRNIKLTCRVTKGRTEHWDIQQMSERRHQKPVHHRTLLHGPTEYGTAGGGCVPYRGFSKRCVIERARNSHSKQPRYIGRGIQKKVQIQPLHGQKST